MCKVYVYSIKTMYRKDSELQRIHLVGTLTTGALLTSCSFQPTLNERFVGPSWGNADLKM